MSLSVVPFLPDEHYGTLCEWWDAQAWPRIPLDHLPPGFLVTDGSELQAAGFIYLTKTAFAWFEWVTVNPAVRREARTQALDLLFESVKNITKGAGVRTVFVSARNPTLIHRLEKFGFQRTDERMTNLVLSVGE